MAVELHIKRLPHGEQPGTILEDEWLRFVDESPSFVLLDEIVAESPTGDRVTMRGPFACWTGHPTVEHVPFSWSYGAVHVRSGDHHVVNGARLVADALDGTLIDDEGEPYAADARDAEPSWEFEVDPEVRPEPVPVNADAGSAPPPVEPVPFDFDGEDTLLERALPWFRRQRRRE